VDEIPFNAADYLLRRQDALTYQEAVNDKLPMGVQRTLHAALRC
jgi:hypothetical protein